MKKLMLTIAICVAAAVCANAQAKQTTQDKQTTQAPQPTQNTYITLDKSAKKTATATSEDMNDVIILRDETTQDGVRVIYAQTCKEVCSRQLAFAVKDSVILEAGFVGGCSGNTQGVCALVKGMKIDEAIARLEGIRCGGKPTSCPDQLARALKYATKETEDGK